MHIYLIGFGDGGSHLLPMLLCGNAKPDQVTVVDGDLFEDKNLDRQHFDPKFLGLNKAKAAQEMYGVEAIAEWFHADMLNPMPDDWIFSGTDNNPARVAALDTVDRCDCWCITNANETSDVESYLYMSEMKGSPNDPRILYPSLLTDRSGDPLGPPGCVEARKSGLRPDNANLAKLAGQMAIDLFDFWTRLRHKEKLTKASRMAWPIHHRKSMWGFRTVKLGDRLPVEEAA